MARPKKLNQQEIEEALKKLPRWRLSEGAIRRTFQFDDFVHAIAFVNKLAEAAEAAQHHPDIDIRYNKVRLALISHDAGGLTTKDFAIAAGADHLA